MIPFEAEKSIELGLVFPGERECALIVQVFASLTIKVDFEENKKEGKNVESLR